MVRRTTNLIWELKGYVLTLHLTDCYNSFPFSFIVKVYLSLPTKHSLERFPVGCYKVNTSSIITSNQRKA